MEEKDTYDEYNIIAIENSDCFDALYEQFIHYVKWETRITRDQTGSEDFLFEKIKGMCLHSIDVTKHK
eukprot:snap_masked-scaffold_59-processed-gene-0.68-mRNA-1 protein AED:1.00 eAED:1.00 QI:0/-1/0/0/-1/1/1/0/67